MIIPKDERIKKMEAKIRDLQHLQKVHCHCGADDYKEKEIAELREKIQNLQK